VHIILGDTYVFIHALSLRKLSNDALCYLQIQMGISGCCWMWSVQGETSSYLCSMQRFVHRVHRKSYFGSLLIH